MSALAAALRAWWEHNILVDAETSARLDLVDMELDVRDGKLPLEVLEAARAEYWAARS
jgi:hypothetical protein